LNQYKRKDSKLPPTAPSGIRRNLVVMTQKVKYRMLDDDDEDEINPMETEAGATMKEEYEMLEPTHRMIDNKVPGRS
jgi:hypothetical protein